MLTTVYTRAWRYCRAPHVFMKAMHSTSWPATDEAFQWHIKFKLASLTFKATHNEVPPYLARLLTPYRPSRVLSHLFLLTSSKFLALTLLSVLVPSVQLHQRFGISFITLSVHPIYLTLSGTTLTHTISKLLLIPPSGKPQRL